MEERPEAGVVAGFLAHEPALVLQGARGNRVRRDDGARARVWLAVTGALCLAAGASAFALMPPDARRAVAVPLVPALVLGWMAATSREKSAVGEVSAALSFSTAAAPAAVASGLPAPATAAIALTYGAFFTVSTLSVRVIVLAVRGGGDVAAVARTRRALAGVVTMAIAVTTLLTSSGYLVQGAPLAIAPGVLLATGVALRPPPPSQLRRVGWVLVAVSAATMLALVGVIRASA